MLVARESRVGLIKIETEWILLYVDLEADDTSVGSLRANHRLTNGFGCDLAAL